MRFKTIFFTIISIFTVFSLQGQNDSDTDFTLQTENRDIASFDKISVNGRFNISINQSEKQEIKIIAPEKIISNVRTENINGVLTINMIDPNQSKTLLESIKDKWSDYLIRKPIEISISVSNLQTIDSKGASTIDLLGLLNANELQINLSGATKATLNTQIGNQLNVSLEEASKLDIKGEVGKLYLNCNGASVFNGNNLAAKDVEVYLIGASRANVYASESIDAKLAGVTKLVCKGNPKQIKQDVSRGSSIVIQ